jgi:CP family cyanate transporter-like MFS transporter
VAPTLLGYVHGTTGAWTGPLLMILCSVAAFILGTSLSLRRVPKPH